MNYLLLFICLIAPNILFLMILGTQSIIYEKNFLDDPLPWIVATSLGSLLYILLDAKYTQIDLQKRVQKAEEDAFGNKGLNEDKEDTFSKRLFNVYSSQINSYQEQTRARARFSFLCAIIASFAGLGFVIWGGFIVISDGDKLAAGSAIAGIGGTVSVFITKTFLEVHKISLNQLNLYFKQPVLNDHILMAKVFADKLSDEKKEKAYRAIIDSLIKLIDNSQRTSSE